MLDKIKEIIDAIAEREECSGMAMHSVGSQYQRDRLMSVSDIALQKYDGDILEIGCHVGLTTKILAEIAQKHGRKVVVVDPWDGRQEGDEAVFQEFLRNVENYKDTISINRISSQSKEAIDMIQSSKFAFCWIDGLHTPQACMSDIIACSTQVGIQAVDDLSWAPGLIEVYHKMSEELGHQKYYNTSCREGYYITESNNG